MHPKDALAEIAYILETANAPTYRVKAFRNAEHIVSDMSSEELAQHIANKTLTDVPNIGPKTAQVIVEATGGSVPMYLQELRDQQSAPTDTIGLTMRATLRGDCHMHSDWSDGGSSIEAMARAAKAIGHEYVVLTDHSPRLTIANGLTAERLVQQLQLVEKLNIELAPFRILTGIEVDIHEDGSLDQDPNLLAQLDVVVGSVHSKLKMDSKAMTMRMVAAIANPNLDILGHCTGRLIAEKKRPESQFDAELVFHAAQQFHKAVEINSRPERLDPPMRLLQLASDLDCIFSIDTDGHAPGQLEWQINGCRRAEEVGIATDRVVNTKSAGDLLAWTAQH